MSTQTATSKGPGGIRMGVQKFGAFLSGMVMPNIAAFIAWGLITALFIPTGWLGAEGPVGWMQWGDSALLGGGIASDGNEYTGLVGPIITFLLPLLIAFTGGNVVYGHRGGVVGAVAAFGVIIGAEGTVMFLGAMIAGPLSALLLKWFEKPWKDKVRSGFEMLANNFSAGFVAFFTSLAAFFWLAPIMKWLTDLLGGAVGWLVNTGLIPLASIIVEPAKVLFLNNAINHGVFTPFGTEQVQESGRSLLFLVEANPGPGAGMLLALMVFGVGAARATAPGAWIIHFLGGIHEVYFPYVLAKPILIVGLIVGGASGVLTNVIFQSGLVAPASPGSIFAVLIQTAPGSHLGVIASVLISAAVSFAISSLFLLGSRKRDLAADAAGEDGLASAIAKTQANKGKSSAVLGGLATGGAAAATKTIENVIFACDAGMGSSAMGAGVLRKKFKDAGIDGVNVTNKSIANLDGTADLVVTQAQLTDRARQGEPEAIHVSVGQFMNAPEYDEVVEMVRAQRSDDAPASAETQPAAAAPASDGGVLKPEYVRIHAGSVTRDEALAEAASILESAGAVTGDYLAAMKAREEKVSTFMGNGLAIPHGTDEAKDAVLGSALSVVRYDGGAPWGDGDTATFVVGIAGKGGAHLEILQSVAIQFGDEQTVAKLSAASTPAELFDLLQEGLA
ncbi:PTS mannitol transporter subunit IICBA [Microbacterium suaedae]|uniref:PTS mannitol transporter subunit IICBA n=1 Tax=Microbacterium suaedae TaxID=2067813 RepID=UPI000DA12DDE|nr:PTS mannitol transporter subunit IICBA [Microbacterium suaedae]